MHAEVSLPPVTDEEIINRVLDGKKNWYELIIRRYNPRLFRIGISIVKDEAETENLMQETYVKAYQNLSRFQMRSSLGTWLSRIMINESLLCLKHRKRILYEEDLLQENEESRPDEHGVTTPAATAENNELKEILENEILQLPINYRMVFMMREVDGLSVKDVSNLLQISASNVKVRLNRAKALLRKELGKRYEAADLFPFHLLRCDRVVLSVLKNI